MLRSTRSELPEDRDERLAAVKRRGRQLRQRRRLAVVTGPVAGVVVVGVALAALNAGAQDDGTRIATTGEEVSTSSSTVPSSTTSTTGEPGSTTSTTTEPDPATTTSTTEAPPGTSPETTTTTASPPEATALGLRARIELSATAVVSGGTVAGELVVANEGAEAVRLLERGCRPKWAVYLRGGEFDGGWAYTLECGPAPLVFQRGETRLPFTVPAVGLTCSDTGSTSSGPAQGAPSCPSVNGPPPLPPGPYEARLGSTSPELSAEPVAVEVLSR